ncbi:hypothetical protein GCM10022415_31870 [Knoellia locipacati]|uniref:Uncharacterized protein n=1 Tax=Knoellia locipacati TaxID=882824 RepID=A0A512T3N6_9MICO|nr:hypothetical protein [Knoellia locipacati]GEQ14809.1 hypothetical protein KLO01_28560 [Knoellia locipacati]
MSDRATATTTGEKVPQGIRRRSLVAKGGAVGVLAWATPVVASAPASASTSTCTPKCFPTSLTPTFTVVRYCPSPGDKWLFVYADVANAGTVCPCDGDSLDAAAPQSVTASGVSWFDTSSSGDCTGGSALTVTNTTWNVPGVGPRAGFILGKVGGGAIGAGCVYGCARVAVKCLDRNGTPTYRYSDMKLRFTATPSQGACGSRMGGLTGNPSGVSSSNTCNAPGPVSGCAG